MATDNDHSRFVVYDEISEKELCKKKKAQKTEDSTNFALRVLFSFCKETKINFTADSPVPPVEELIGLLRKFYMCVRNEKGDYYKVNSMKSLRSSLQRYFLDKYKIDIIHDVRFIEPNTVFENMLKQIKSVGKGEVNHHSEIELEDMKKLYESFDIHDAMGVQEMVWTNIMYVFIRRGRQNVRNMTKKTFAVDTDASGKRYIFQVQGELDKNHSIGDDNFDTPGEGRIYEIGGDRCPVRVFELYLSKLNNELDDLWQRPRKLKSYENESIWYCKMPHGEHYLGNMMSMMSTKYELSQHYTNHCLRVTSLQTLDDAHIEGRHIIRVSGHKRVDSVENYARKLSAAKKRKISNILTQHCQVDQPQPCLSKDTEEVHVSEVSTVSTPDTDISDSDMANLHSSILKSDENRVNFSGLLNFAPVLNSCSNVSFNIYMKND